MDILIDGLAHWFANTAYQGEYPPSYHPLIDQRWVASDPPGPVQHIVVRPSEFPPAPLPLN
jgi:hypothetical protein